MTNIITPQEKTMRKNLINKLFASREGIKVHRNDKCPCGSGKKFKHCHLTK